MREVVKTYKVYKFDELSDSAQDHAVETLYDLNVSHDWWNAIYDDANEVGLVIHEFDFHRYIRGDFKQSTIDVANAIISGHGKACDTYSVAQNFIATYPVILDTDSDDIAQDKEFTKSDMDDQFLKDILECYLSALQADYDYLTSREAIIEMIHSNDYEFTEDGDLF